MLSSTVIFRECDIGAVVKVVDSHPCGRGSIPGESCGFFIVSLALCSDQYVKYLWITFMLRSSTITFKQKIIKTIYTVLVISKCINSEENFLEIKRL